MKVSNRFTFARVLFAPIFYIIFNLPVWLDSDVLKIISACIMIPSLVFFELTDYWDGHYARKYGEVSDFGKIFDPFADVILNLTVFLCAVSAGYMPVALFVLIFYREFCQNFLRMIAMGNGVAVAARMGGKIKTVFYIISGFLFVAFESFIRFNFTSVPPEVYENVKSVFGYSSLISFILCAVISWVSFAGYVRGLLPGRCEG